MLGLWTCKAVEVGDIINYVMTSPPSRHLQDAAACHVGHGNGHPNCADGPVGGNDAQDGGLQVEDAVDDHRLDELEEEGCRQTQGGRPGNG